MSIIRDALDKALATVTKDWVREKRREETARNEDRLSQYQLERLREKDAAQREKDIIKATAYRFLRQAYLAASDNGKLPANARQIMYTCRPLVLAEIGKCWKKSSTFTQQILPDYVAEHPSETAAWDVVYDARGHLREPHVSVSLGLGTLEVRSYVHSWRTNNSSGLMLPGFSNIYPTYGPANRYRFALFVEKEGFDPLLQRSRIAERCDLAIFSSKGQSNVATRSLVDHLSRAGVTVVRLHDFDAAGLSIAYNLAHSNKRYTFSAKPRVIDLGLGLTDVKRLGLQSEPVEYKQVKDPREKLLDYGASETEANFLVEEHVSRKKWRGKRVELNAMTSRQFIDFLEGKLEKHGVEKVMPDKETLKHAWRRAQTLVIVNAAISKITKEETEVAPLPRAIEKRIRKLQQAHPELSWDECLARIAKSMSKP